MSYYEEDTMAFNEYEYVTSSAKVEQERGERSETKGYYKDAVRSYKNAVKQLQRAMDLKPEEGGVITTRLNELTKKINVLENMTENTVSVQNVPKTKPTDNKTTNKTTNNPSEYEGYDLNIVMPNKNVSFDDIIGLKSAKNAIHDLLIYPLQNPEAFHKYQLSAGGCILLEGPPGTGKTTFAKATACEINLPFVEVSCPTLVDKYIGESAKKVKNLFDELRRFVKNEKKPLVVFFDEFDAIAKVRSAENKTAQEVVPALIREISGFDTDNDNIIILAATNLKSQLDEAVQSRFTKSINIPLPDKKSREEMFKAKLISFAAFTDEDLKQINLSKLSEESSYMSGRDIQYIIESFCRLLAKRDAGIEPLNGTYMQILTKLIRDRKRGVE